MGRIDPLARALLGLGTLIAAVPAQAFTPTVSSAGISVRWKGNVKLDLAGNPVNQSGITDTQFFNSVVRSLQRWNAASGGTVRFDYWQGKDPEVYVPASAYEGLSTIYFASNSRSQNSVSSNVLGLTQVWYDTNSGHVLEADILLNDRDFRFTTNLRDTSGYGSGGSSFVDGRSNVFIDNVITHELGHAFGLSHSGGLQSTMLFMESPEQAHLSCDELTAIRALYPSVFGGQRGSITGQVVSEAGAPVFGAHVLAVSRRRGTVLATALTDAGGRYTLSALEPGVYFLMAEPFYAGPQTLPTYYSNVRSDLCPGGRSYSRSALTQSADGSALVPLDVAAGHSEAAPALRVRCGGAGAAAMPDTSGGELYSGTQPGASGGFGVADQFSSSSTKRYRIARLSGKLEVHILSYSLYSPIGAALTLLDSSGTEVTTRSWSKVYEGDSGYVNYDSALSAENLPSGDYVLEVEASYLDTRLYPAGPVAMDSVPFFFLTGSVNEGAPILANEIPVNARCRMEESFGSYQSPSGDPPRHSGDDDGLGFCSTVSSGDSTGGPGSPPPAVFGWFLPWAAMAATWGTFRLRRTRRALLSVAPQVRVQSPASTRFLTR